MAGDLFKHLFAMDVLFSTLFIKENGTKGKIEEIKVAIDDN